MSGLSSKAAPLSRDELEALRGFAYEKGALIERERLGVASFGSELEVGFDGGLLREDALSELSELLQRLQAGSSCRPLATMAVPFRPDEPFTAVVGRVSLEWTPEGASAVVTAEARRHDEVFSGLLETARRHFGVAKPEPDSFELTSDRPHEDFLERVARAVEEVRKGAFEKVVLARQVMVEANRDFEAAGILQRLRSLYPSCTTFSVRGFLGASPELVIARDGGRLVSRPLAGTAPRSGDAESDDRIERALFTSEKERNEHRVVVDAIAKGLAPVAALSVPEEPSIIELRNVSHLQTTIEGELFSEEGDRRPSALELLSLLHPTPAVSGAPREAALSYIEATEGFSRGRYGGAVGFMRAGGDGEFYLGIRSAEIEHSSARLSAGVGIVAGSEPESELRETQLKLQAMLAAAVRP